MREYCTYFDRRYLPRGLALLRSLERHGRPFRLWVLCLDQACAEHLTSLRHDALVTVTLEDLERGDPQLAASRATRSQIEYYFTCTPAWVWFVMHREPTVSELTYLDADLFFFSDPEPVFEESRPYSVSITPHRYADRARRRFARYGMHNVGWLTFRRDDDGMRCLAWWRERCIEWCYDRVQGDRYADQKYLDAFPLVSERVRTITHVGANAAPWNIGAYEVGGERDRPTIGDSPLVFYHFQGVRKLAPRTYDTNLAVYGASLSPSVRELIYVPYLRELDAIEGSLPEFLIRPEPLRYRPRNWRERALRAVGFWLIDARARARRTIVYL